MIQLLIISLYIFFLLFILFYSIAEVKLTITYLKFKHKNKNSETDYRTNVHYPIVTIQLPVYNELYVIERLINQVCEFDWPKEKLEIQVLDDSTDETSAIISRKVNEWKNKGLDISHIQRTDRSGFKAGALAYATEICKGEFIAIFDADFIPPKDFLLKTIPYFKDAEIGVVQTRWGHLNQNNSLITKMQAFALDAHFKNEQVGRNEAGYFINFNGTAGVWRKETIYDAGGWQSDTLTEDLDLSYRAQLKGWKFKYCEDIVSPAELPITMNALKKQQFRWSKGAAECTRKNLGKVIVKKDIPLSTKVMAIFHLMNSFLYIAVMSLVTLSIPVLLIIAKNPQYSFLFGLLSIFYISTFFLGIIYYTANRNTEENIMISLGKFILFFPLFLSLTMGIGLYNMIGVVEGYLGKKSSFIRTPKFNANHTNSSDIVVENKYNKERIPAIVYLEIIFAIYASIGIFLAIKHNDINMFLFLIMVFIGFSFTAFYTIKHAKIGK